MATIRDFRTKVRPIPATRKPPRQRKTTDEPKDFVAMESVPFPEFPSKEQQKQWPSVLQKILMVIDSHCGGDGTMTPLENGWLAIRDVRIHEQDRTFKYRKERDTFHGKQELTIDYSSALIVGADTVLPLVLTPDTEDFYVRLPSLFQFVETRALRFEAEKEVLKEYNYLVQKAKLLPHQLLLIRSQ